MIPRVVFAHKVASADFKSKKIRINLNTPIKAEQKAESTDVLKTVDEDRKYVIQATIVRCVLSRFLIVHLMSLMLMHGVLQYHEGAQDDEEPGAYPGGHLTDLAALHAQDPGYQEGGFTPRATCPMYSRSFAFH